jgi:predicted membrane channel-forming protein YqfA (hemolysin III family)
MPHLFVNRPRQHDLFGKAPSLEDNFRWETINAVTYQVGGLLFIAGSICFFPVLSAYANLGAWIFFLGSLFYLLVTGHDMAEVIRYKRIYAGPPTVWDRLDFWAATTYVVGTILFVVGSIFFLSSVGLFAVGAGCFVIGSILFVVGTTINVLEIVQATELFTLQLMNLTAVAFVAGSVLFTVASVPYLWQFANISDREEVEAFLAWQYLAGSFLFFAGGLFNYRRAFTVLQRELQERAVS